MIGRFSQLILIGSLQPEVHVQHFSVNGSELGLAANYTLAKGNSRGNLDHVYKQH
jgi:hypothetical protein